jgi:hypothetical protein
MKEAWSFSEMSVLTRSTRRNFPENAILHSDRRENLKVYNLISAVVYIWLPKQSLPRNQSERGVEVNSHGRDKTGRVISPLPNSSLRSGA